MSAIVTKVESVTPYGENLSIVKTVCGHEVIANKKEDGSFRWAPQETVVYVSEGSILPEAILKDRGYWDEEKDRGLLDGGKRNRVKMKKLAGFESRGLLFKCHHPGLGWDDDNRPEGMVGYICNPHFSEDADWVPVVEGQDVTEYFGIEEFKG